MLVPTRRAEDLYALVAASPGAPRRAPGPWRRAPPPPRPPPEPTPPLPGPLPEGYLKPADPNQAH